MKYLIYDYTDYKEALSDKVTLLKKTKSKYSIRYLSEVLKIQYTFLSKVLNSETHHLNEDQVFLAGQALEFLHDEIDYLLLLRSYAATDNTNRKNFLFQRISTLQKQKNLSVDVAQAQRSHLSDDLSYLMDDQFILIHVALWIKEIQKNPLLLTQYLGIDSSKVKNCLILLDRMGQIEYDQNNHKIIKIQNTRTHFGKDHPLTRTHQFLMKTFLNQKSLTQVEEKKENLFFTFTTDQSGFEKIKLQIKEFASSIQKTTFDGKHKGVYQLNIDFLEIFNIESRA